MAIAPAKMTPGQKLVPDAPIAPYLSKTSETSERPRGSFLGMRFLHVFCIDEREYKIVRLFVRLMQLFFLG